jgi:hypothetical protein
MIGSPDVIPHPGFFISDVCRHIKISAAVASQQKTANKLTKPSPVSTNTGRIT